MSGDIYNCDKCGESIHTSCDCGFPDNDTMKKENLELRALVSFARNNFVEQEYGTDIEKAWLKKAEKYKQGREG